MRSRFGSGQPKAGIVGSDSKGADLALECEALSRSFDGVKAVDGVSVGFRAGIVTALVGPNGAGKTTLFHLIAGVLAPDRGAIRFRGANLAGLPPWEVARKGVGRLFQDVRVFASLTALENLRVARPFVVGEGVLSALLRPLAVRRDEDQARREALELLERVGLADVASRRAGELAYGQQKLLALARLLSSGATLLLLDEPTAGLEPSTVAAVLSLVRQAAEDGKTVLVIEHNMNVVLEIADWVNFFDQGRLVAFGLPGDVLGDRAVREAYLGT